MYGCELLVIVIDGKGMRFGYCLAQRFRKR